MDLPLGAKHTLHCTSIYITVAQRTPHFANIYSRSRRSAQQHSARRFHPQVPVQLGSGNGILHQLSDRLHNRRQSPEVGVAFPGTGLTGLPRRLHSIVAAAAVVATRGTLRRPWGTVVDCADVGQLVEYPITRPPDCRIEGVEPPRGVLLRGPPEREWILESAVACCGICLYAMLWCPATGASAHPSFNYL